MQQKCLGTAIFTFSFASHSIHACRVDWLTQSNVTRTLWIILMLLTDTFLNVSTLLFVISSRVPSVIIGCGTGTKYSRLYQFLYVQHHYWQANVELKKILDAHAAVLYRYIPGCVTGFLSTSTFSSPGKTYVQLLKTYSCRFSNTTLPTQRDVFCTLLDRLPIAHIRI